MKGGRFLQRKRKKFHYRPGKKRDIGKERKRIFKF